MPEFGESLSAPPSQATYAAGFPRPQAWVTRWTRGAIAPTLLNVQRSALSIVLRFMPWLLAALVSGGCATSTAPGAVGITRKQLMIEPSAAVAARAAEGYARSLRVHSRERISQQTLSQAVVTAIANTGSRNAGAHGALAALGSKLFLQLPFSREMELEAGVRGRELMARAGFDPAEAKNVWVKMQQASTSRSVEFFNTHPDNERRVAALAEAEGKVRGLYAPVAPAAVAMPAPVNALAASAATARAQAAPSAEAATRRPQPLVAESRPVQGKDGYQVERLARNSACGTAASARLTDSGRVMRSTRLNAQGTSGGRIAVSSGIVGAWSGGSPWLVVNGKRRRREAGEDRSRSSAATRGLDDSLTAVNGSDH